MIKKSSTQTSGKTIHEPTILTSAGYRYSCSKLRAQVEEKGEPLKE
jgi:hypothetical protein